MRAQSIVRCCALLITLFCLAGCGGNEGGGSTNPAPLPGIKDAQPKKQPPSTSTEAEEAFSQLQVANDMFQMGLAMRAYLGQHGRFPPADGAKVEKIPQLEGLSWRAYLMGTMTSDQNTQLSPPDLYRNLLSGSKLFTPMKPEEPWNRRYLKDIVLYPFAPPPSQKAKEGWHTHYRAFTGNGAAFEPGQQLSTRDFKDGLSNTILFVEAGEPVPWTKPAELQYDPKKPLPKLGGTFKDGFLAVFGDGSVRFIPHKLDEKVIRAMITRNGRERIPGFPARVNTEKLRKLAAPLLNGNEQAYEKTTFTADGDRLFSLTYSPDGNTLATGGRGSKGVKLWDATSQSLQATLATGDIATKLGFSPDGKLLGVVHSGGPLHLWDVANRKSKAIIKEPGSVKDFAFSPDSKSIAMASSIGNEVHVHDLTTGKTTTLKGHTDEVHAVAWSKDDALASASSDGTIRLWDIKAGITKETLRGPTGFRALAFSPDGKKLASAAEGGLIQVWDTSSKKEIATSFLPGIEISLTFSPDNSLLASTSGSVLRIQNLITRKTVEINVSEHHPSQIAFGPDGQHLAGAGYSGKVILWKVVSLK